MREAHIAQVCASHAFEEKGLREHSIDGGTLDLVAEPLLTGSCDADVVQNS